MFFWILCGTGAFGPVPGYIYKHRLTTRNIPERSTNSLQCQPRRHSGKDKGHIHFGSGLQFLAPKRRHCLHGPRYRALFRQVRLANAIRYVFHWCKCRTRAKYTD
jgi:hypothetical protein